MTFSRTGMMLYERRNASSKDGLRRGGDTDDSRMEENFISMKRYGLPKPDGGSE